MSNLISNNPAANAPPETKAAAGTLYTKPDGSQVVEDGDLYTTRIKVPGGWIYRSYHMDKQVMGMCFVPNVHDPIPQLVAALERAYSDGIHFLNEGHFYRKIEWDTGYIADALAAGKAAR